MRSRGACVVAPSSWLLRRRPRRARSTRGCFRRRARACSKGPDRDVWQRPDQIMDALHIGEGSVVADLGAGGGWFTIRLARRVGPNGTVYAEDIQPQMIEAIERRVQREGLQQREDGARHAARSTSAERRARCRADRRRLSRDRAAGYAAPQLATSLKPTGLIGIVEFTKDGGGPGPRMDERVDPGARHPRR